MTKTTDEFINSIKEIELPPREYKINGELINVEHTFIIRTALTTKEFIAVRDLWEHRQYHDINDHWFADKKYWKPLQAVIERIKK